MDFRVVRFGVLFLLATADIANGFASIQRRGWHVSGRSMPSIRLQAATLTVPTNITDLGAVDINTSLRNGFSQQTQTHHHHHAFADPSQIEFVSSQDIHRDEDEQLFEHHPEDYPDACMYPFVNMLRGSARYISEHRGKIAVFHIPGELLEQAFFKKLMDDIALSWLLGLKIVIVVGCRYDVECYQQGFANGPECINSLRVTNDRLLRDIEEEAGYVRFEVERQLNRCLRLQGGLSPSNEHKPMPHGNVVGGNFFLSKPFGVIEGTDFENSGYASRVHVEKIQQVLNNNDVVLLTTVGTSRLGTCVNVNGNHLAALVASELNAHKLVYFSNQGAVLRKTDKDNKSTLQDIPVSFCRDLLDHHKVQVHRAGFANFEHASQTLGGDPSAVEMLLHLGWSSWALEQGVKRAHIVNPGDGALLEELYTARHGVNTCLYQDKNDELQDQFDDVDGIADDLKDILAAMALLPNHQDPVFQP